MPEKPEVITVAKTLERIILGKEIKEVEVFWDNIIATNLEEFKDKIKGERVKSITTKGKFIIIFLTNYALLIHLRMEGKFFFRKKGDKLLKHEHVIIRFTDDSEMRYHDTRKFGKIYLIPKDNVYKTAPLNKLGYDYYDKELKTEYLFGKFKNIKKPIKETLLDQSIIAGIGNIYADEILFASKISPYHVTNKLKNNSIDDIILNTKKVLSEAVKLGGTTIKSFTSAEGVHGLFQNKLKVHGKKDMACPICGEKIIKVRIGGRGTYYCKNCQK